MSTNQRDSFRCPTPDYGTKALLEVRRRKFTAELIDQSAGGFSVSVPGKCRMRPGERLKIRTNAGWCEAQVVHAEVQNKQTRIGLQRLRDLPDPRIEASFAANSLPFKGRDRVPSGTSLALVVVAFGVFWICHTKPIWFAAVAGWVKTQAASYANSSSPSGTEGQISAVTTTAEQK